MDHLVEHCWWLARNTPWLTDEQRDGYIRADLDLLAHALQEPDFLKAAFLKPPAAPE